MGKRVNAVKAMWILAGLTLMNIYSITNGPFSYDSLVFPSFLLVTIMILGAITVFALPRD